MNRKPKVKSVAVILPQSDKGNIEVHFTYSLKILEIMRRLHGRYRPLPVPHWEFPNKETSEVISALKKDKLVVHIMKRKSNSFGSTTLKLSRCRICGKFELVDSHEVCEECKKKQKY
ncbi:hypothetical protein A3K72_00645 [Candidatus Woesearchaeota archaeon RBG_13_36_6]|nr:MAG: hypothetical protein A3K72_00645 [Candidatus Woesearchaeota archaeon RBG_13_36_6]